MYDQDFRQMFRAAHFSVERFGPAGWQLTPAIIGELRVLSYVEQWKRAIQEEWFHIKLEDHSLFLFNESGPSYSYLHSPIAADSFRTFLNRKGLEYSVKNRNANQEEYELLVQTAPLREFITPIRYDWDKVAYRSGRHPLAHIHIGYENSIRIGARREMTAISFVLFVMRQMYPDSWERLLEYKEQFRLERRIRDGLSLVGEDYWKEFDGLELHLT